MVVPRGGAREGAGRKPKGPEKLVNLLKVLLTTTDRKRLEKTAIAQGVAPSELARNFILKELTKAEKTAGRSASRRR